MDKGGDGMKGIRWKVQWRSVLLGLGVGMMTVICLCAVGAAMMEKGAVGLDTMGLWAAGITVGSGLLASLAASLGGGEMLDAILAVAGELVVLLGLNGVLNDGEVEGIAVTILALAGGCGAALLLRMGKGGGRRRRRRTGKNR